MAEDSSRRKAEDTHGPSEHDDAGAPGDADYNEEHVLRHKQPIPSRSRKRATSCDSMLEVGRRRKPYSSLSPLVSWDDTSLINRHHVAPISYVDESMSMRQPGAVSTSRVDDSRSTHKPQAAPASRSPFSTLIDKLRVTPVSNFGDFLATIRGHQSDTTLRGAAFSMEKDQLEADRVQMDRAQKDQVEMGITIRRTQNINVFDSPGEVKHSDAYQSPGPPSPAESDSGPNFVEKRLLHPDEYFQELDDLGSKVFQKSMFHFYTVSCK
jgi:hypothetical protein